jgi:3-oxoadipate enol-lactonase
MFATINGHEACYHQLPSPHDDAPRVLLIMGFGMAGAAWRPIANRLSHAHKVVYFDPRGIGKSSRGEGPHGIIPLADDAASLLDHLNWPDAHLIGVSMGGMVAQRMALRHRGMARSLSLMVTHGGPFYRTIPGATGIRRFLAANTAKGEARLLALADLLFPNGNLDEVLGGGVLSKEELRVASEAADPSIRAAHLRSIANHHTLPELAALHDLPSLILQAQQDILVPPRCSDHLHAALPGSRIIRFPDAGHGLFVQHPDEVSRHLAEHIAAADQAR